MALACGPDLLIADEPTTALDVTMQQQILDLISDLVAERNMALILISHDLGVISQNADRMLVMYGGSVVESGPTEAVFATMAHPYTRGPFAARPQLVPRRGGSARAWPPFPGTVPELVDLPAGCPFAGRCGFTMDACHTTPPPPVPLGALGALGAGHMARHPARCHARRTGGWRMNTATTPDLIADSAYPISTTGQFDSKTPADAPTPPAAGDATGAPLPAAAHAPLRSRRSRCRRCRAWISPWRRAAAWASWVNRARANPRWPGW
jgi:oligopeptide/dipeptide ABC transporter ATP-binding protein